MPKGPRAGVFSIDGEAQNSRYVLCASSLFAYVVESWAPCARRTVVLCVDGQADVAALVRGAASSSEVGDVLIGSLGDASARIDTHWRAEYVHTKSNTADERSRRFEGPARGRCSRVSGALPKSFTRDAESWISIRKYPTCVTNAKRPIPQYRPIGILTREFMVKVMFLFTFLADFACFAAYLGFLGKKIPDKMIRRNGGIC